MAKAAGAFCGLYWNSCPGWPERLVGFWIRRVLQRVLQVLTGFVYVYVARVLGLGFVLSMSPELRVSGLTGKPRRS